MRNDFRSFRPAFGGPAALRSRVLTGFARSVQSFEPSFPWMGYCGAVCFVFYWVVWSLWVPQPYENLPLRLLGMLLSIGLGSSNRWPPAVRERWLVPYAYVTLLYVFPFFFTYMLLQNQANSVWVMSTLVACFLMILLIDALNFLIMQLLGAVLAGLLYVALGDQPAVPLLHPRELLLFVFLVVMGSIFNIRAELLLREKSRAMLLMGARMAHEIRTPLAGIKIGLAGLMRALEQSQLSGPDARPTGRAWRELHGLKEQITAQANHAGTIIDMLLLNENRENSRFNRMEVLWFGEIITTTLENYPFVSPAERALVRVTGEFRFHVRGQRDLLICVLYNLLKNALYAVHRSGRGGAGLIEIDEYVSSRGHHVLVRDAGDGIRAAELPRIFEQFFTTKPDCDGIGIGLFNTRHILHSHNGDITCRSEQGVGTEFDLRFPFVAEPEEIPQPSQGSGHSLSRTVSRTAETA